MNLLDGFLYELDDEGFLYELELLGLLYEELEEGRFDELEPFRDSISAKISIKSKILIRKS